MSTTSTIKKKVTIKDSTSTFEKNKPPSYYANQFIEDLMSTLLPSIAALVQHYWNQYFKLQQKSFEIDNKLKKMNSENYIPKSASINFTLGGSSDVTESLEFTTLKQETISVVDTFKKAITDKVLKHYGCVLYVQKCIWFEKN